MPIPPPPPPRTIYALVIILMHPSGFGAPTICAQILDMYSNIIAIKFAFPPVASLSILYLTSPREESGVEKQ